MEIDFRELKASLRYKLLTALVIPRPIAWITSIDGSGLVNAAPYSFFNVLGNEPPLVAFAPSNRSDGTRKDTARNVEDAREFVVNLVDQEAAELMHATAAAFPPDRSEVEALALATIPSVLVRPPRLAVSKVHMECVFVGKFSHGNNQVLFGEVTYVHVPDGWVEPTTYHMEPGTFHAVGRLQGPSWYATTNERFSLGPYPPVPPRGDEG